MKLHKPELVLPGGDLERAKIALDYGADAVYVGLNIYSLRKGEVRFNISEIKKAIEYAHSRGKKIYVTFNIFAHNEHLKELEEDMAKIAKLNPDAFIMADIGVIQIAKRVAPHVPIHISTQANTTNIEDVRFWQSIGAKRVVLARELTLKEIAEIRRSVPDIELEVFAHGSMCISYSGRCLLSNYMAGRHSNLGDCAQPCRWNYRVYLEEKQRPGEFFEIEENESGTNIMSSKDLRTIEHLDEMLEAGITGFKVEGRNKTEYYLACTALAYREGLDLAYSGKYTDKDKKRLAKELEKVAHRSYTSGFLFGEAKSGATFEGRSPVQNWEYVGQITSHLEPHTSNLYEVLIKNKMKTGMAVEVLTPGEIKKDKILEIIVGEMETADASPGKRDQRVNIKLGTVYPMKSLLRAPVNKG